VTRAHNFALNAEVYNQPTVVRHYASLDSLTACERMLFDRYIDAGMSVLDLGVGGGRTTFDLSQRTSRYVGIDCSEEMIQVCRHKYPALDFKVADASDLSQFGDSSFDAVIFSFNGIDCLTPAAKRLQCLQECKRVLRTGGVFIFSTHNPRAIFVRPAWSQEKVRRFAEKVVGANHGILSFTIFAATLLKALHAAARALVLSLSRIPRIFTSAFWRGEGYVRERVHGGLSLYHAVPKCVVRELQSHQFRFWEVLGNDYPLSIGAWSTDWYYYVFTKTGQR
jgi:ubiquinone/menaquinone biosynthesis C-methylase UbiE